MPENSTELFQGRHYSVKELADAWNLSPDTIRRLFADEPGVLVIENPDRRHGRRRYASLRIPESVARRVYQKLSVVNLSVIHI